MEIFQVVGIAFDWFMDNTLFDIPVLYLLLGIVFIGLIIGFVKGTRK